MHRIVSLCLVTLVFGWASSSSAQTQSLTPAQYRDDALGIETTINTAYAYLDRFSGDVMPMSDVLRTEAGAVTDSRSLLKYAEHALLSLADHHAITGRSFSDDWALVPSYSDLWIEKVGSDFVIEAVRAGSPAATAGIREGDRLSAIGEVRPDDAVAAFWADLGLPVNDERAAFAARILAAGRRDRERDLTVTTAEGAERRLTLKNLYQIVQDRPRVTTTTEGDGLVIRLNDSLGDNATIADFDAEMAKATDGQPIIIDLTDTPSGGNTVVARAIMGWFVSAPTAYQIHNLPSEERETGIPRQWIEQVLPRPAKHHSGPVSVRVGRWTGSMGEGLAVGFDAIGARVTGGPMARLLGAVSDIALPNSGLVLKMPTERLSTVGGNPREAFVPAY